MFVLYAVLFQQHALELSSILRTMNMLFTHVTIIIYFGLLHIIMCVYNSDIQNLRIHEHSIQCGISILIWTAGNWKFFYLYQCHSDMVKYNCNNYTLFEQLHAHIGMPKSYLPAPISHGVITLVHFTLCASSLYCIQITASSIQH